MRLEHLTLSLLFVAVPGRAQKPDWTLFQPPTSPEVRVGHSLVYDSVRRHTVLFGGASSTTSGPRFLQDTWVWSGTTWTQSKPATSPAARWGHATAFDSVRGRGVLFGGGQTQDATFLSNAETWEWDGASWNQRKPVTAPAARGFHAMVYDSARNVTVLFGGVRGSGLTATCDDETWEWDGVVWTRARPKTAPIARCKHAMAYDSARRRVVLFGGADTQNVPLADTWEWDGQDWVKLSPKASPGVRTDHAMVYDDARHRTLLFGGWAKSRQSAETWAWDGDDWTLLAPATSPSARSSKLAFDSSRQRVVLFGGYDGKYLNDTWEYAGPFLTLTSDTSTASLGAKGVQRLRLDAGSAHANKLYLLLGTLSGTSPGLVLSTSVTLPLNYDAYLLATLAYPNALHLSASLGTLDASGRATAAFHASPPLPPALVGKVFHHAFVVISPPGFDLASNAVPVTLLK